jgi:hypothetical protein
LAELLGGEQVGSHVRLMLGSQERPFITMQDAAVR